MLKRRLRKVLIFAFSEFLFYFGSSWLELDTVSFSRTQFGTQQGHFEGMAGIATSEKREANGKG
ncbi:MAG: hypothetical protein P8Y80_00050 [Acidobacteriota bacterium]|jgi:hypothetical protein